MSNKKDSVIFKILNKYNLEFIKNNEKNKDKDKEFLDKLEDFIDELITYSQNFYDKLCLIPANESTVYVTLWYGNGRPEFNRHDFELQNSVIKIATGCYNFYTDILSDYDCTDDGTNNIDNPLEFIKEYFEDRKIVYVHNIDKTKELKVYIDRNNKIVNHDMIISN